MSVFRHPAAALGGGLRNWFGDGSDGHIRLTAAAGAEQSFDGVFWSPMPGWTNTAGLITVPSVQDGDMVVVNARNLTVDTGVTLTTANRCRGLLIYATGNVLINGTVSMTARGCKANPADSTVTANTPVAPSDGLPVSINGLRIAKFAPGYTASGASDLSGCGLAARNAEANQPAVTLSGVVIDIPRVGGPGGVPKINPTNPGGTAAGAPGGGGSGAPDADNTPLGKAGGSATCFSGGPGGGGESISGATAGDNYGGPGGQGATSHARGGGGAGNPGGGANGGNGTAGLLVIIARGNVDGAGAMESRGVAGGNATAGGAGGGGGSGGGVVLILYGGSLSPTLTTNVSGGPGGGGGCFVGGAGGSGSKITHHITP